MFFKMLRQMKLLFILPLPDPNRKNARFQGPTPLQTEDNRIHALPNIHWSVQIGLCAERH